MKLRGKTKEMVEEKKKRPKGKPQFLTKPISKES